MTRERLYLFDTTLRDGAQTTGVDFSLDDKRQIAAMLDELGVDYVEGGYPGANPIDTRLLRAQADQARAILRLRHDQAARPLGGQRSRRRRPCSPPTPTRSSSSPRPGTITSTSRSAARWRRTSTASSTASKRRSPPAARRWSTASISSTATRPIRTMRSPARAPPINAGARWVVLCDTNGGTLPHEIERIVAEVGARHSRRPSRHPRPQRHRQRRRQFACRRARRRAPGARHAERPRRALRQRQSRVAHPDAGAERRVRRPVRDRRVATDRCASSPRSRALSTNC